MGQPSIGSKISFIGMVRMLSLTAIFLSLRQYPSISAAVLHFILKISIIDREENVKEEQIVEYAVRGGDILLYTPDFSLDETLDCGQAFRWEKQSGGKNTVYRGAFLNTELTATELGGGEFCLYDTDEQTFLSVWKDYFDLDTDYGEIKRRLSADKTLEKACLYAGGIRLLRQDPWEALCSFIISQNNNIPRIKGIIARLTGHFKGFPTYSRLAEETPDSLGFLRAGFRAKYLIDAAQKLQSGEVSLEKAAACDIDEARRELMTIKGVGPKVAECALLYGMHRLQAFPVDVWIRRVMEKWYPNGLPDCCKGIEGVAQQYLFHYIRTADNVIEDSRADKTEQCCLQTEV